MWNKNLCSETNDIKLTAKSDVVASLQVDLAKYNSKPAPQQRELQEWPHWKYKLYILEFIY